jgi:stress-induced morphogen
MSRTIRGSSDAYLEQIDDALRLYEIRHPRAAIEIYRENSASIRIRIIDPDFAGCDRAQRHNDVWRHYLGNLSDDVQGEISVLLLLTPEETETSFANVEFDHPIPSNL